MAPTADGGGTDAEQGRSLTAEQLAEIEKSKKQLGGVAAGAKLFDLRHPNAAARRERRGLVQDLAKELRGFK